MTFYGMIFDPEFPGRFMPMYQKADFEFKQNNSFLRKSTAQTVNSLSHKTIL